MKYVRERELQLKMKWEKQVSRALGRLAAPSTPD
jgi:hypothetical protein